MRLTTKSMYCSTSTWTPPHFSTQVLCNLGAEVGGEHRLGVGFRQVGETVRAGMSDHLVEIARRVERLEFVVQQVGIAETFGREPWNSASTLASTPSAGATSSRKSTMPRASRAFSSGVALAPLASSMASRSDLLGLPSRIDVVAHVGHTVGSQQPAERGQQRVLHLRGHPAVHAVGDDEVELSQARPRSICAISPASSSRLSRPKRLHAGAPWSICTCDRSMPDNTGAADALRRRGLRSPLRHSRFRARERSRHRVSPARTDGRPRPGVPGPTADTRPSCTASCRSRRAAGQSHRRMSRSARAWSAG